jgi:hypothetical protein
VRNWGYPQQIRSQAIQLFAPLENEIEASFGVRVEHLIEMCANVMKTIEHRATRRLSQLRPALTAKRLENLADSFLKAFPSAASSHQELLSYIGDNRMNLAGAKSMLLSYSDQFLPQNFTFSLAT